MRPAKVPNSIHQKLLLISLLPLGLLSLALGWYMISTQSSELQNNLNDRGKTAVSQTASYAEFAFQSGDESMLEVLGLTALEAPEVTGVLFASYEEGELIRMGDIDFDFSQVPAGYDDGTPFYFMNHWYFFSDIVNQNVPGQNKNYIFDPQPKPVGWVLLQLTDKYLKEKRAYMISATLAVIVLALLAAFWLSVRIGRVISRPLESLTQVVGEMEQGNLESVANEMGLHELDKLAQGINSLATNVRESKVRMESEIERATSQLQVTLVDLEEAMKTKDQFLARMSHELRTPLTAVMGFTDLLSKETDESERRKHIRMIYRCSDVLLTVIDDILDFSKANVRGFTLNNKTFNLVSLIDDTTTVFSRQASDKGLTYEVTIEQDVPKYVSGDAARLAQVLTNLFSNAIKFTEKGGVRTNIKFIGEKDKSLQLEFSVTDTGKGIAKEKIDMLFHAFTQEDSSISRRFGGSGLGLSISKSLVKAMGGEISVSSKVDVGSTFTFTCQFAEPDTVPTLQRIKDHFPTPQEVLSGVSILVAEDNPFNQELLLKLLSGYGASCAISQTGREAIDMAKNPEVDVVLMDMHMPEIDGIVASETIVKNSKDSPPIIGLTADIMESEQQKMIAAGAIKVLLKPIDEVQLIYAILDAINRKPPDAKLSGNGLLGNVLPKRELKKALMDNLDRLETALQSDQNAVREIIHDLMGLSGLYGMSELRSLVVNLSEQQKHLGSKETQHMLKHIREHIENSAVFDQ
jgi:signal transduction histidine kinase/DNA-binding response OmpR family regulator